MNRNTTIALLSGGLDSTTATALAIERGQEIIGVSFDYGQRHLKELEAAKKIAKFLNLKEHLIVKINLSSWGGSSLTDLQKPIPSTGVVEGVIPTTYVPGRNTVFISIGLSLAEAREANSLILGINAMDYSGYPDCRPDFLNAFQELANLSSKAGREGNGIKLNAPLMYWDKIKIVQEALRLQIPIKDTWSCYAGKKEPCGVCDSCRIRNKALNDIGRPDLCSH